jgi:cyclic pyranopterin phosphate synthase
MVDVGAKAATQRRAIVEAKVRVSRELAEAIAANTLKKGNLLEVARLAGIQAAKRTDELIPLCHGLPLEHVDVRLKLRRDGVYIQAEAKTTAKTGVEMEAYTAAAMAALTVIDMGKAVDAGMVVESIRLIEKTGGRRGTIRPHVSEYSEEE